jgi:nucleoside-diphosphate-sugar epimerase
MRVLIAGCGYVGTALGLRLAASGATVWGVRRDPSALPAPLIPVAADLSDERALTPLLPPALDAVVYTAAAGGFTDEAYRRAYVDGIRSLLGALVKGGHRPERILFTSSTGVYGQTDGRWVDEETPPDPVAFNGTRVLEGEELLRASPFRTVSLRLGGIYGPGRDSLMQRLRAGGVRCPAPPMWSNRIHRDDCAGALAHLLTLPDPAPVYVGVDREPADLCEIMTWLARRMGVEPPEPAEEGEEPGARGSGKRCSSARLVASGYPFAHPTYREGFAALLAADRSRGRP